MLVNKVIPGLYNGVSQQPPTMRLDTQAEEMINCWASIVDGLYKRPPTEFVALLASNVGPESFIHLINRDQNERYLVLLTGDAVEPIEVFTFDGTKCEVRYGALDDDLNFTADDTVKNYLNGVSTPRNGFRAVTIADTTLIANTQMTVTLDPTVDDVPASAKNKALVYIKRGVADTDYTVSLTGYNEITSTSGTTDAPATWKTNAIAQDLAAKLTSDAGIAADFNVVCRGSVITLQRKDAADFGFAVRDSFGNQAMVGIKGVVQKFTDLPTEAEDQLVVEISGDNGKGVDNWYVRFKSDPANSPGVWVETVQPGQRNTLDPNTLPHRLVRTASNQFTFARCEWAKRKVGDEFSAPDPSFINEKISDLFYHKDRLGVLSGEAVTLSRAGEYFNFFPTTALDVLDNDPIDIVPASTQVALLRFAIAFNAALLLFSDQQQFLLHSGDKQLAPTTVACNLSTTIETYNTVRPIAAGPNVYFVSPNGDYAALREYFVAPDTMVNDAANVSAHCPRYLPKDVVVLTGSTSKDVMLLVSASDPRTVYIYKYLWAGQEKAQSAWGKWTFNEDVLNVAVFENWIWLLQKKGTQVVLNKINLEKIVTAGLPYRVHLDMLCEVQGVYDINTDTTTWTLPYQDADATFKVIMADTGFEVFNATHPTADTMTAVGNYSAATAWIGKQYGLRYRFTPWMLKDPNTGVANTQGRLQVRTLTVTFTHTGYFRIEATPLRREMVIHQWNTGYSYMEQIPPDGEPIMDEMTGVIVGQSTVGIPTIMSGKHRAMILCNSEGSIIELVNDSHLPSEFQTAEWEGYFVSRSRAI